MDFDRYWSHTQQTISTLDNHRKLRFNSINVQKIIQYFCIEKDHKLFDAGCGTGVLLESISRHFQQSIDVVGIDRDISFIETAQKKKIPNSQFLIGDALQTPFPMETFDRAISYTVIEHVDVDNFLKEQYKILKKDGIIGIMTCTPPATIKKRPYFTEELALYDKLYEKIIEPNTKNDFEPFSIPMKLEECGFTDIEIETVSLPILWDLNTYSIEQKIDIVQSKAKEELGYIELIENKLSLKNNSSEIVALKQFVQKRLADRICDIENGKKNWEIEMNYTLSIKGRKP